MKLMKLKAKIYLGADHAGFALKEKIKEWLKEWNYAFEDKGAFALDEQDDYPDFVMPVAKAVAEDPANRRGIIVGGSGQGEAMGANRFSQVRSVVFYGPVSAHETIDTEGRTSTDPFEIVKLSRSHNDANMLALGARFVKEEEAKEAVKLWLETPFLGEERHARRIKKIDLWQS